MALQINPSQRNTFQPEEGGPSWIFRPMTLEEEHLLFDLQSAKGVWMARLWILRNLLVDVEDWKLDFEANEKTGGASDAFIQSIPVTQRGNLCEHVWTGVVLSEADLEK